MRPTTPELELVGEAVRALRRGRNPSLHPRACAARTRTGEVVTTLGLGDSCPEPAAVAAVLGAGGEVATLVTVRHTGEDTTVVEAPCAECRAVLRRHAPGVRVVHLAGGLQVAGVADLP